MLATSQIPSADLAPTHTQSGVINLEGKSGHAPALPETLHGSAAPSHKSTESLEGPEPLLLSPQPDWMSEIALPHL